MVDHQGPFAADGVGGVLYELRQELERGRQGGLVLAEEGPRPMQVQGLIKRLQGEIELQAEVIKHPQPGQGLASLALRLVADRFLKLEHSLQQVGSVEQAIFHDNDHLFWLSGAGEQFTLNLQHWRAKQPSAIQSILTPVTTHLDTLRGKLDEWESMPQQPDRWRSEAGWLLLGTIDLCEVDMEQVRTEQVAHAALESIFYGGGPLLDHLTGPDRSIEGLRIVLEGLTPSAASAEETTESDNPQEPKRRKATADERMKAELASNLETVKGWTAQKWADHLGCAKSTIIETKTWESMSLLRQQAKAEKRNDRHRKKS